MSFTAILGGCFFYVQKRTCFCVLFDVLVNFCIWAFPDFFYFCFAFVVLIFFGKKDFFSERICQAGLFVVPPFGFITSLRPAPFRNGSAATTIPNASALGRARERTRQISEFCASKISQQTAGLQIPNAS